MLSIPVTRGTLKDEVLRLVGDGRRTAFMITHDVDEAILLADRILLMTNGPDAWLAEIVVNTLPRPRDRASIHRMPGYYALRNHIVDFLVSRSRALAGVRPTPDWRGQPAPEVYPADNPPSAQHQLIREMT
jgi:nitrate/nitrite transport system ATP-binding protein